MQLAKNKKYLVGVSGGPDSMALLDLTYQSGVSLIVCHVNYKKRKTADRDQAIVTKYCEQRSIKCYVKTVHEKCLGNFQMWARDYRYNFFHEIYQKENCNELLIAHQADDFLETYLSKIERASGRENPAILVHNHIFGMDVYRPLLGYFKQDLIKYCEDNNIEYGIDETNLVGIYHRNQIRLKLQSLPTEQKKQLYLEAKQAQETVEKELKEANKYLQKCVKKDELDIPTLLSFPDNIRVAVLYLFIEENSHYSSLQLSKGRINDLLSKLKTNKNNFLNILSKQEVIERRYDKLVVCSHPVPYQYTMTKLEKLETPYFKILSSGSKLEGICVLESDYPLTIRPYKAGDMVNVNEGHKNVARIYVDKKIPLSVRQSLPLLINAQGEILLISGVFQDIERKTLQSNVFVVKC
ncbi:MAG: tRNA lysidine(34) synthetase TilS [Bacilli bacterium]|nr:tRNA lysidine(34) synthetase TilS [Bacilli bacterium]MDD3422447.1 tRNA lysidine(34) synthetase TilS [Bacilli bacterium]MDD4065687.1 tRNA lysidine(34) synthetase TilS [Bacilli bacterium]